MRNFYFLFSSKGQFAGLFERCLKTKEGGLTRLRHSGKKGLTHREYLFCNNYVNSGDVKRSAEAAGYKVEPELAGNKLLQRDDISAKIDELYGQKKRNLLYKACRGYEKLAFGGISDAIKLIYSENISPEKVCKMDLFNVAEIKRPRDGMLEIKFFDRFKALEKLQQLDFLGANQNTSFYDAIEGSIKSINFADHFEN